MYWKPVELTRRLKDAPGSHFLVMADERGALVHVGQPRGWDGKVTVRVTPLLPPIRSHDMEYAGDEPFSVIAERWDPDAEIVTAAPFTVRSSVAMRPADEPVVHDTKYDENSLKAAGGAVSVLLASVGALVRTPVVLVVGLLVILGIGVARWGSRRSTEQVEPVAGPIQIRSFGDQRLDRHNVVRYARWRLEHPDLEPEGQLLDRAERAHARIDDVREEYGALKLDVVYHIDHPALFDGNAPTTAQLLAALWEAEHLDEKVPAATVEALASKVEVAYAVAREHAERAGIAHVPKGKRSSVRRAAKAARLAVRGATEGERAAAANQLRSILESLALYYLPSVEEVRALEAPSEDASVDTGR